MELKVGNQLEKEKRPKMDTKNAAEKETKSMPKVSQNDTKMDTKINENRYDFRTRDFVFFAKSMK